MISNSNRLKNMWKKSMRYHGVNKFIGVTMGLIAEKINVKITHNTNNFVFVKFRKSLFKVFNKFINICVRMSVCTANNNIFTFRTSVYFYP